jgi:hypothetical protein
MKTEAYLFVYYRGNDAADDEQVYFSVSQDGLIWNEVNGGKPILRSTIGEKGVRDISIARTQNNSFVIVATDLCLYRNFKEKYKNDWREIGRNGSHCISLWESDDLVQWSSQKLIPVAGDDFGCVWDPDILFDRKNAVYLLYWSSSNVCDNYTEKAIYSANTTDFEHFSSPQLLYRKKGSSLIDPEIRFAEGKYYRFIKSRSNPFSTIMESGNSLFGDFSAVSGFDSAMAKVEANSYEGPTFYQLNDGRWCLMLDYFGSGGKKGYKPFIAATLENGNFEFSENAARFPHVFRNGKVIPITTDEYQTLLHCFPDTSHKE